MPTNTAAWIESAKSKPFAVKEAPYTAPKAGQIVIKNAAVAINPVDWKIQEYNPFETPYPNILGEDIAGTVEEVGPEVVRFKKGDRVIAHCLGLMTRQPSENAFQAYTVASEVTVSALPDNIPFEAGAVLPLAISTAAQGLYLKDALALDYPSVNSKPNGQWLVIWGGSSSVGATAIQLAVASGYQVLTTASPRNHALCKAVGASLVVDYNNKDVVNEIVDLLKDKDVAGVYDAISENGTIETSVEIVQKTTGPSKVAIVLGGGADASKEVQVTSVMAPAIATNEVAPAVWQQFVPAALAQGKLVPKPDPEVVGTGFKFIQEGVTALQKGVSAKKLVVKV